MELSKKFHLPLLQSIKKIQTQLFPHQMKTDFDNTAINSSILINQSCRRIKTKPLKEAISNEAITYHRHPAPTTVKECLSLPKDMI